MLMSEAAAAAAAAAAAVSRTTTGITRGRTNALGWYSLLQRRPETSATALKISRHVYLGQSGDVHRGQDALLGRHHP